MSVLQVVQKLVQMEWPVRLAKPLFGKFNPFLPEFRSDPYAQYARLRAQAPVYFSLALQGWIVTRYADVAAVLADPRFSVRRQESNLFRRFNVFGGLRPEFADVLLHTLLMLDPPHHTRLRKLVSGAFTPRRIEQLRARTVEIVAALLDRVATRGEMDLIADLAHPLPMTVIAELLGVPQADRQQFKLWSEALTAVLDPLQAEGGMRPAEEAFFAMRDYLGAIFRQRRTAPAEDLISALVQAGEAGDRLSETELLALVMLLLAAGNETTTNLIANGVLALLAHPAERRRWCENPELTRSAVEELLRYDSPVQLTDRVATEDLDLHGHRVRKGQLVGLIIGAANRDPQRFAAPDRLDLGREDNPHLAFGHGVHFCLGAQLARLEAQVALPALLERFPDFAVQSGRVEWKRSLVLRGPVSLHLQLS